ncbi:MAG: glycosyltransferase family 39 protein [Candidatus Solibacter usitatus]|nr:glycosyltransferase family 39 protein [Candidatus Solibacter usitatus]
MDDVDAVQAQIARNMLESGDWVTARLDGVAYLEKSPLVYWMMACSFAVFGPHDWAARLPLALFTVMLCWLTARFGNWAFGRPAGLYSGLALATSVGLFLFTRIQIPDALLTLTITLAMWAVVRVGQTRRPAVWACVFWASLGVGLLLKGLIAVVIPLAAGALYLFFAKQDWRALRPFPGVLLMVAIAAPWHVLATLRNPPYFDFTMHSEAGSYRGFFWFYFFNEHILRFLNLRYPRDYNTVPRLYFWLFHLLWLFPWSGYLPAAFRAGFRPADRAGRTRLLALCWTGFLLVFFTFSTTQEYYSMPCYPALALLIGSALASGGRWPRYGTRAVAVVASLALAAIAALLIRVHGVPAPGDIAGALTQNPDLYTLSLGHLTDLTLDSFAYLRLPLAVAGAAFLIGAIGAWKWEGRRAALSLALMMVVFFHAARLALVVFDPYLGSRPLAEALLRVPEGRLIVDDQYYAFSSVFFYTNRRALLLNGRVNNLEYGSYAPGAPDVFLDDAGLARLWTGPERCYLIAASPAVLRLEKLVGKDRLRVVAASGGKFLFGNQGGAGR